MTIALFLVFCVASWLVIRWDNRRHERRQREHIERSGYGFMKDREE